MHACIDMSTCVFICSLNYWRNARYGIRRNIDMCVAYTGSVIYVIHGYLYINNSIVLYTGFPIGCVIYATYMFGKKKYNINKHRLTWVKYHMLFHLLTVIEQAIIIYYSTNNNNLKKYLLNIK